ncbi:MAG: hypothetical protein ABIA77_07180 [Candidatus Omnitrophota bacterium]
MSIQSRFQIKVKQANKRREKRRKLTKKGIDASKYYCNGIYVGHTEKVSE